MTITVSDLPDDLAMGPYWLSVSVGGRTSRSVRANLACSLSIRTPPSNSEALLGATVTFAVVAEGGRGFQWQKSIDGGANFANIPGATSSVYATPPLAASDSGTRYRAMVSGACGSLQSTSAVLLVTDTQGPVVAVQSPTGGSRIPIGTSQPIIWTATDNIRVCKATAALEGRDVAFGRRGWRSSLHRGPERIVSAARSWSGGESADLHRAFDVPFRSARVLVPRESTGVGSEWKRKRGGDERDVLHREAGSGGPDPDPVEPRAHADSTGFDRGGT